MRLASVRKEVGRYRVWVDVKKMQGSVVDKMAEAIEGTEAMLFCVSRQYKESANCRLGAQYAFQRKLTLIPLMMEANYQPNGCSGFCSARVSGMAFTAARLKAMPHSSRRPALMREIGNRSKLPKLDSDLSRSSSAAHDTTGAGTPEAMDSAPGTEPVPEPEPAGVK